MEKYLNIISQYETRLAAEEKLSNILGYTKLIVFLAMVTAIVLTITSGFSLIGIFSTIAIIGSCTMLWTYHYIADEKVRYSQGIIKICRRHISQLDGTWIKFEDSGADLADASHFYASDLDIVGDKSFFQFLNTTSTWWGREKFAVDLLNAQYSLEEIAVRQQAVQELSADINFAIDIQFHLGQIKRANTDAKLCDELTNAKPLELRVPKPVLYFMSIATVLLLAAGGLFGLRAMLVTGVVLAVAQAFFTYWEKDRVHDYLGVMARLPYRLGKYVMAIEVVTARKFSSLRLQEIKTTLEVAHGAIRELDSIVSKLSFRANALLYLALNVLLLWDFYCAFMLERWKAKHSAHLRGWFEAIGEFESLLAFSHLPNVCDNVCLPRVVEVGKKITAKNLGHPLIANNKRVANDVNFSDEIYIVSGSNMSGKTTFMRTVGVNLVLANAGSCVCAQQMECAKFDVLTSMRIADDLNQGVSTFYAELTRVKLILETSAERENLLFLIDEIFKGTNSVDRLAGADAVISKLAQIGAAGMVSTHDLELCKLAEHSPRIKNYNFRENYVNGAICFDYKMRQGPSQTTNAKFLMEALGIIGGST